MNSLSASLITQSIVAEAPVSVNHKLKVEGSKLNGDRRKAEFKADSTQVHQHAGK
jgi:hypothetical protein